MYSTFPLATAFLWLMQLALSTYLHIAAAMTSQVFLLHSFKILMASQLISTTQVVAVPKCMQQCNGPIPSTNSGFLYLFSACLAALPDFRSRSPYPRGQPYLQRPHSARDDLDSETDSLESIYKQLSAASVRRFAQFLKLTYLIILILLLLKPHKQLRSLLVVKFCIQRGICTSPHLHQYGTQPLQVLCLFCCKKWPVDGATNLFVQF